jgi:hypothetical protein
MPNRELNARGVGHRWICFAPKGLFQRASLPATRRIVESFGIL